MKADKLEFYWLIGAWNLGFFIVWYDFCMRWEVIYEQLKNQIRVGVIPLQESEAVMTMILVKTGSRNEIDEKLGISHVLEHMVFKGTPTYPTPQALAAAVDSMGAEFNAFTSKEYTGYYIKAAAAYQSKALEILTEMMLSPLLKEDDLEREKGVIIQEIKMYQDQPREIAMEEFENLIFQGSNLGRLIIGNPKTVSGITVQDLVNYKNQWYKGANILILVAGKVKAEKVIDQVRSLWEKTKKGGLSKFVDKGSFGKEKEKIIDKKTQQTHFVVGVPGLSINDPRRYVEAVLRVALGGNMSSRLFVEVREKRGLAYYVGAVAEHYYDVGFIGARAGVKKDKFDEALKVVKDQMQQMSVNLSLEEVERAKKYLVGKIALSLEGPSGVVSWVSKRMVLGLPVEKPKEVIEKIESVNQDQVGSLAKELFETNNMYLVVVQ